MEEGKGHIYLRKLQRQWLSYALVSNLFIALAFSTLFISALSRFTDLSFLLILPLTLVITCGMLIWSGIFKTREKDGANNGTNHHEKTKYYAPKNGTF